MFAAKEKNLAQDIVIKRLIKSIAALISVIKLENNILEKGKLSELNVVCEKKILCLEEFNEAELMLEDFAQYNILNKQDMALPKLKGIFAELQELNERNDILLKANIEASSKIMEFYKEAQKNKITKNYGYNSQGKITATKNLEKIMPSISLNNKV